MNRTPCTLLALLALIAACDSRAPQAATKQDSAGIGIVTHDARAPEDTIDLASDGAIELKPGGSHDFYVITGAVLLPDGTIAIANRGSAEILFFNAAGDQTGVFGRQGEGPGEFIELGSIVHMGGDTMAALDLQLRRITLLTPSGMVRNYPMRWPDRASPPQARGGIAGSLSNGSLAVWLQTNPRDEEDLRRWNTPNTVGNVPVILFVIDSLGNTTNTIGEFPGEDLYSGTIGGGSEPYNLGPAPFGNWTQFAAESDRIHAFVSRTSGYLIYEPDGSVREAHRLQWPGREVTRADRETYLRTRIWPSTRPELRAAFEAMPMPERMPAYRDAVIGGDNVWLEPYHLWDGERRTYIGFNSDGEAVGTVRIGYRDRILHMRDGVAIVRGIDELNEERVRVLRF